MRDFFHCRNFLPRYFLARFFPSKSVCMIFFSEITHISPTPPTQKSNGWPTPSIPGIGIQNTIEVQKKTFSLLLDVNQRSQETFNVRKSLVSQNSFLLPALFILMWSLPYGPMKDLHQQTVTREKEWGGGVGMNEREWASLTTKLSDFGHQ